MLYLRHKKESNRPQGVDLVRKSNYRITTLTRQSSGVVFLCLKTSTAKRKNECQ